MRALLALLLALALLAGCGDAAPVSEPDLLVRGDQPQQHRRLHRGHRKLEHVADPLLGRCRVRDVARLDRRLEALRVGIRADGERGAGELEEAEIHCSPSPLGEGRGEGANSWIRPPCVDSLSWW